MNSLIYTLDNNWIKLQLISFNQFSTYM